MTVSPPPDVSGTLARITAELVNDSDPAVMLGLVTTACATILPVAGVGVMLTDPRGGIRVIYASDDRSRFVELLQTQTDQGPCLECIATGTPVAVPDLRQATQRWPVFVSAALDAGYRAIHALPMRLSRRAVGGLNLLFTTEQHLEPQQQQSGQLLADLAVLGLVQDDSERPDRLAEQTLRLLNDRITFGHAVGLTAGTLDIEVDDARDLLLGHAAHRQQPLRDLARAITDGTIRPEALGPNPG